MKAFNSNHVAYVLGEIPRSLTVAHEYQQAGETVQLLFAGTATRWPAALNKSSHPLNALYKQVLDTVVGGKTVKPEDILAAAEGKTATLILDGKGGGAARRPALGWASR